MQAEPGRVAVLEGYVHMLQQRIEAVEVAGALAGAVRRQGSTAYS